jgi:hypothetical protein
MGVGEGSSQPARAKALLDRGLEKYARGDLLGALNEWEHALSIDRTLSLATEYIEYVRANFDLLSEQFAQAAAVEESAAEAGIPVTEQADDPDAYDSIELSGDEGTSPPPLPPPPDDGGMPGLSVGDLSMSLGLTDLGDPLATSDEMHAVHHDIDLEHPMGSHDTQDTTLSRQRGQIRQEPETYGGPTSVPLTIRPRATRPPSHPGELPAPPVTAAPPILDLDLGPPLDEHHTPPRGGDAPATEEPFSLGDDDTHEATRPRARGAMGSGFADELPTRERHSKEHELDEPTPDPAFADSLDLAPPTLKPGPPAVIIDDPVLARQTTPTAPMPMPPPAPPSETADDDDDQSGLAPAASEGDRIRRRVNEHLHQAMIAAEIGDFARAVAEAESAATADPEGLIAPIILARHRDFLHRVYEGHLGDTSRVPLVAVPLHEISAQHLDHRTGFLLSRIDGMLTFEDILDVAGMPRIEAYKILSQLLRKGFIEVR